MSGQPTPTLTTLSSTFDPEMDSYFDLEQNDYTPSLSPESSRSQSTVHRQSFASGSSSFGKQPAMSGPSHQYDAYRQQTGLPAGGLASTFAMNQSSNLGFDMGSSNFVMPVDLSFPLTSTDDYDFNTSPSQDMNDMDFDVDAPSDLPAMFYPGKSQFVNPSALAGESSSAPQIQRMYPGMHSERAAQAKAQQEKQQEKQQELARRQQQQRQQQALESQRPLPAKAAKSDPAVDERISRLLQQMRQNSTSQEDEDDDLSSLPQMSKLKKEEEEMDEDERLLASEEGKKLSSKERRQLRNKVSARAFRSRRKEYIGQLEGEVATKTQEANELRNRNRQLIEENNRLTSLTRVLLSSPAFSGFLNELSTNGGSVPSALQKTPAAPQPAPQQQHPQPQAQPTRKDVNPNQIARQMQRQQQVGMVMIPETSFDFSSLDLGVSDGWNSGVDMNTFQVYSVTEMPEPAIDVSALSGKNSSPLAAKPVESKDLPKLPSLPAIKAEQAIPTVNPDVVLDESLSLFDVVSPIKSEPLAKIIPLKSLRFNLTTVSNNHASSLEQLTTKIAEIDTALQGLESFTGHL